jgi:hypothetical protein
MMENLFSKEVLLALGLLSGVFFIATLIIIPIVLVRLPDDYFDERRPRAWLENRHPAVRAVAYALKNVVGAVFLLAGLAMIVLPGQGVLTILIGISLMDFPGKRKFERRLIGQRTVLKTINKIREKFGRNPLVVKDVGD